MSRGQRPRWPAFFPKMKVRGKGRPRRPRIVTYTDEWVPIWPPTFRPSVPGKPWAVWHDPINPQPEETPAMNENDTPEEGD